MQNILIIQTAFIGDALLSIPLLKNLRSRYPTSEITYLCRHGIGNFLSSLHLVDHVVELDKRDFKNYEKIKNDLQLQDWDWVICPHESLRSQILSFSLKANRKTSYKGFARGLIFDDLVERPVDLPEALRTLALLENVHPEIMQLVEEYRQRADSFQEVKFDMNKEMTRDFGLKNPQHKNIIRKFREISPLTSMEIDHFIKIRRKEINPSEKVETIAAQAAGRKVFVLAPGSVWETKIWRRDYYRKICEQLCEENFVILIGGPDERSLCQDLIEGLQHIYNAAGETSLWESAELIALADQVLTNDSGAMHLASLSSARVLSVFGPTVIEQGYRPWNNEAKTIESVMYCRPCGKHGAKKCPLGHHACMKLVYPERVLEIIDNL